MIPVTTAPVPETRTAWEAQRASLRDRLWQLLGDLPPLFTPQITVLGKTTRDGCMVEHFVFDNGAGAQVYGYFLLPPNPTKPLPALLYMHAHGGKYDIGKDELFNERGGKRVGQTLVEAGYAVMAVDTYCFGERINQGPVNTEESGREVEHALFKHFLWRGSSLWGMLVRDDLLALNALLARPEIDPNRVGVTGMSLGGSRTTWVGALDDRPGVLIPVAQMTRYRDFAEAGRYNGHSVYYYFPGVLKTDLDMEHLVALVAPRPQAILSGDADPLSPFAGIEKVLAYAHQVYQLYDASDQLQTLIETGVGHDYTPNMFAFMLRTLNSALLT